DPASAAYTFKGQQLTATSRQPEFALLEQKRMEDRINKTEELAKKEKEGKKENVIISLLNALLRIVTWKRGG
ncbi:MAG: hypothetical protein AABX69_04865, partial [Nanoarchaeota archaeon]